MMTQTPGQASGMPDRRRAFTERRLSRTDIRSRTALSLYQFALSEQAPPPHRIRNALVPFFASANADIAKRLRIALPAIAMSDTI